MWGLEEEGCLGAKGEAWLLLASASFLSSRSLFRAASQQLLVGQGCFSKPIQNPLETPER